MFFFLTGTVSYETHVFCCMGYKLATGMCYFSFRLGVWNTHVFLSVKFKYVTSMCFFLSYSIEYETGMCFTLWDSNM